jgi:hypothetical protein
MVLAAALQLGLMAVCGTALLALISEFTHMDSPHFHTFTALMWAVISGLLAVVWLPCVITFHREAQRVIDAAEDITRDTGEGSR